MGLNTLLPLTMDYREYEDLVKEVIQEEHSEQTTWEVSEMEEAVNHVAMGASQNKTAEKFEFSQGTISRILSIIETAIEEQREQEERDRGIVIDPVERDAENFREFLDDLREEFDLQLNDKFLAIAERHVNMHGQLPSLGDFKYMLEQYDSGIPEGRGEIGFIVDSYWHWLEDYRDPNTGWRRASPASGKSLFHYVPGNRSR